MNDSTTVTEKTQTIVYFNVGGAIFQVLRETLQNYSTSLLARLVKEFPDLGSESHPVFVDRSPKAFEWILEIYRNGNYDSCIPKLSKVALERELDFYQLPTMVDLGISDSVCLNHEIEEASKWCGKLLAKKLTKHDLWKSLPLYACFYKTLKNDKPYGEHKVVIAHKIESNRLIGVPDSDNGTFTIFLKTVNHRLSDPWVSAISLDQETTYLMKNVNNTQTLGILKSATLAFGLCLQAPSNSESSFPGAVIVSLAAAEPRRHRFE